MSLSGLTGSLGIYTNRQRFQGLPHQENTAQTVSTVEGKRLVVLLAGEILEFRRVCI